MAGNPQKKAKREKADKLFATSDFWEMIFDEISTGQNLPGLAHAANLPYRWIIDKINSSPELRANYDKAKNAQGISQAERISELAAKVESGEIEPNAGRVAIDARKWLASRFNPEQFGERTQHDVKLTSVHKLHLDAHQELAAKFSPKVINPAKEIEHAKENN
jgi:hypothetical protein